jgi:hypothetical protein
MRPSGFQLVSWCAALCLAIAAALPSSGQELRLRNKALDVGFDSVQGGLAHLGAAGDRANVLDGVASDLWEAELAAGPVKRVSASGAKLFRSEPARPGLDALRLTWSGFGIAAAPRLQVIATVSLDKIQPLTRWSLEIRQAANLQFQKIHFLRIPHISRQAGERLAVPVWMGQETGAAREMLAQDGDHRLEWEYPGLLSMQCLAISSQSGAGLYLACDDTAAFHKIFAVFADTAGDLGVEVVHLPEPRLGDTALGMPSTWGLPYQVLLGTLDGDWITAAEWYRSWATNQAWVLQSRLRKGTVSTWARETGLWVWNRGRSGQVLEPAAQLQRASGLPISVFWHWWHGCAYDTGFPEYLPPREGEGSFKSAVANADEQGLHALVYMNQRLWGMTTKSWTNENAERFAVKYPDGRVHPEVYNTFNQAPCASMCMGTPFWREKYAGIAGTVIRELGVDGIYMDQACSSLACYDPNHPHPPGGGTFWMDGFRRLSQDIRGRTRMAKAVVLAGEGCGESWLPYLDLMLSLQVSKERYAGTNGWETIPFFNAVYHSHAITFGNYSSLTMPPYDELWPAEFAPREPLKLLDTNFSKQFRLEQARAFVWGQQPTIANYLPGQWVERRAEIGYLIQLARLRSTAAKYLLEGTFLRPPGLGVAEETFPFSRLSIYAGQQGGLRVFQSKSALALAGAWRAPDGDVALALASISDEPLKVAFDVDAKSWGMVGASAWLSTATRARQPLGHVTGDSFPVRLTLPAQGAALLEFNGR